MVNIVSNGVEKESGRANMPNTIGISKGEIRMDLSEGFPLLTTKKMYWKGIVHELLWFLRGETNIKYLVDNNVNIWNSDAYRWYCSTCNGMGAAKPYEDGLMGVIPIQYGTVESFTEAVKNLKEPLLVRDNYYLGDLGKVYGYQWRNQNGVDQVKDVVEGLKKNPYSRYHIIDGWNKADFNEMALPPCHLLYQFIVRPLSVEERWELLQSVEWKELNQTSTDDAELMRICDDHSIPKFYLDLNMYQRSCDTMLGVPFNIASMSLLLMIMAKASNMIAGVATWIGGDTHLYVSHLPAVEEQISRETRKLPTMIIKKDLNSLEDILALTIDDFELEGYDPHPAIKAELFTGLKK